MDAPARVASGAYVTSYQSSANSASYTFSSSSIGTADADRIVVVAVFGSVASADRTLSAVSIGGTNATLMATAYRNGTNDHTAALAALAVSSGTTATIVVNWSGAMVGCRIAIYTVLIAGATISVASSITGTGVNTNSISVTLSSVPANAVIFAAAITSETFSGSTFGGTAGISGTTAINQVVETSVSGAAHHVNYQASAGTDVTITATFTTSTSAYALAAVALNV